MFLFFFKLLLIITINVLYIYSTWDETTPLRSFICSAFQSHVLLHRHTHTSYHSNAPILFINFFISRNPLSGSFFYFNKKKPSQRKPVQQIFCFTCHFINQNAVRDFFVISGAVQSVFVLILTLPGNKHHSIRFYFFRYLISFQAFWPRFFTCTNRVYD